MAEGRGRLKLRRRAEAPKDLWGGKTRGKKKDQVKELLATGRKAAQKRQARRAGPRHMPKKHSLKGNSKQKSGVRQKRSINFARSGVTRISKKVYLSRGEL